MKITKMQGLGNDYIYINCLEEKVGDPAALARRISDRHFGVGSDGLVLILPCTEADFRMRMFNADGSEAEMCGNASRCVGKYLYDNGLTDREEIRLMTGAGLKVLQLTVRNGKTERVRGSRFDPCVSAGEQDRRRSDRVRRQTVQHDLREHGQPAHSHLCG